MVAVDEHGEPTEAAQTTAEFQKQIDGLQSQITDMHRARETTGENPNLSSEVQTAGPKHRETKPASVSKYCPPGTEPSPQRERQQEVPFQHPGPAYGKSEQAPHQRM